MKEKKVKYTVNVKQQQDDQGNHHNIYQFFISNDSPRKKILADRFRGIIK